MGMFLFLYLNPPSALLSVSPLPLRGIPPSGGNVPLTSPSICRLLAAAKRQPKGCGTAKRRRSRYRQRAPVWGRRRSRGGTSKRAAGGFRSKIKRAHSPTGGIMARTAGKVKADPLLLRLADFCGAGRRPLAKTGALRQTRLAVSSAGRASACLPLALSESCGTIVYTPE